MEVCYCCIKAPVYSEWKAVSFSNKDLITGKDYLIPDVIETLFVLCKHCHDQFWQLRGHTVGNHAWGVKYYFLRYVGIADLISWEPE